MPPTIQEARAALRDAKAHGTEDAITQAAQALAQAEAAKVAKAQAARLPPPAADPQVHAKLALSLRDGTPKPTRGNIAIIFREDELYKGKLTYDLFARQVLYLGQNAADQMDTEVATDLEYRYNLACDSKLVAEVAYMVAQDHTFHPVRDYLDSLQWDGTPRMAGLFQEVFHQEPVPGHEEFYQECARKFLMACVARIREPGCKVDYMLILTGEQSVGKSEGLRLLVSPTCAPAGGWFTDSPVDMASKEGAIQVRGNWILELGELDSWRKAEAATVKRYISSRFDDYRPPFGRHAIKVPRETVITGSCNPKKFLSDPTGNRRYIVVEVEGEIPFQWIRENRDQLWAEAQAAYSVHAAHMAAGHPPETSPERYWFNKEESRRLTRINLGYMDDDIWEETVKAGLLRIKQSTWTPAEVLTKVLGKQPEFHTKGDKSRVGDILTALGCTQVRPREKDGRPYAFRLPPEWSAANTTDETKVLPFSKPRTV